ncbi:unnamed protein product [Allacma fusca]|uniref:Uncharacterized protein n=1 Tax=Allacma fusca TaxID=39272 RepID=A0A8J2KLU5_9HEXA|nr:unnamed protein product [Allacma fusca]
MRVFKINWLLKLSHPLLLGQEYLLIGRPKDSGINLYTDFEFDKKLTLVLVSTGFVRGYDLNNNLEVRFSYPKTHATDDRFIAHTSISLGEIFEVKESEKIYNRVDVFSLQCPPVRAGFLHYTLTLLKKS